MRFQDRVAVITGAGTGIGKAAALRLASEGAAVILVGRTQSKLEETAEEITRRGDGHPADIFSADVTSEEAVARLSKFIREKYGNLHVLVNNAGGSHQSKLFDLTEQAWDQVQNVNLKSIFLASKHLGRMMADAAGNESDPVDRSIVNIASLSGHQAGAQIPHYSAAKAAVISLSKSLALELAPYRIRVNSISPGFVETPLTADGLKNDRFVNAIRKNTALRRVGRPEEIANVIAFAASPEASYMTGSDLLVDGGWLIM
ncbi:SDR family NAD(P)-dependent oxidoreductase [Peribacillus sp. SCS-155]|uniref:SDR family NAD(P)-dependent oxidoreductase n=1 Tax=Peribacillus sedimenti TaxID=3115297 RepID=UPI0039061BA0